MNSIYKIYLKILINKCILYYPIQNYANVFLELIIEI